jgi:FtsP/CotA-like multicopper oxidase with cupredoxin domain
LPRVRWLVVGMVAGCLVAGCGGDDGDQEAAATTVATTGASTGSQATTTTAGFSGVLIEATVTGDKVETASRRVRIDRGQKVRIRVQADRAEEVHLHGYDLSADVAPGRPAVIDFTADAPGVFEVELEQAHLRLFELQIQ